MLHKDRCWRITDAACVEQLAELLTERTWTLCTGFRLGGVLFLNDATGPDGAQEYAAVRESDSVQVESWTCSWMTAERCAELIREMLDCGAQTQFASRVTVSRHPQGACWACR